MFGTVCEIVCSSAEGSSTLVVSPMFDYGDYENWREKSVWTPCYETGELIAEIWDKEVLNLSTCWINDVRALEECEAYRLKFWRH